MDIPLLQRQRVMVIIRHDALFNSVELCYSVLEAGFNIVEIPMNTPGAPDLIGKAAASLNPDMVIGAGTVLSVDECKKALDAGASFIVSPVFNLTVVEYCTKINVPVFPGAATPTEVYNAYLAGATMVKLFPASAFGPSYIKSLKGPLGNMPILAVGGINGSNVHEYLSQGADAVAIGSGTIMPEWISNGDFNAVTDALRTFRLSMGEFYSQ